MEIEHNVELLRGTNAEWNGSDSDRIIERGVLAYNRDTGEMRVGPGTWATCKPVGIDVDLSVHSAANSNVTIANGLNNGDTVAGKVLVTGEFVLLTGETDNTKNGPYTVGATPARHPDFTTFDSIAGKCFHVTAGNNAGKVYRCISATGGTLNTDPILFVEVQPRVLHFSKLNQASGIVVKTSPAGTDKLFVEDGTTKDIEVMSLATLKIWVNT